MQDNHIYTSGATGTNAAVIRGALRAEKPHLLTVVLPQSRHRQPPESQELLEQVPDNSLHKPVEPCSCRIGTVHADAPAPPGSLLDVSWLIAPFSLWGAGAECH
jgi:hypothetical protein